LINNFKTKLLLSIVAFFLVSTSAIAALIVNPAQPITHSVSVQPVIVSDNDGSNTATFFGNPGQQSIIEGFVDNIWAQAGIDVKFLAANTWDNSFANFGNSLPRPQSDLNQLLSDGASAGVLNANPNVINLFFVNIPAGFSQLGLNFAAGYALIGENGISQYVGSNLLSFRAGQEAIATVVAHEIGHNFGLIHTNTLNFPEGNANLMWSGIEGPSNRTGQLLNSSQITTALSSRFVTPVPLPAAVWLFGSALLTLFGMKRRIGKSLMSRSQI